MSAHPLGTPRGTASSVGILASAGWLVARGLYIPPDKPWHVTVVLPSNEHFDTQLTVRIENAQWMAELAHAGKHSTIVIMEGAVVANPDELELGSGGPSLKELGTFLHDLEAKFRLTWKRQSPVIETTIAGSEPVIRAWIASL